MMRISREQLVAFEPAEQRRFVERVARSLREHFASLSDVTDPELFAFVQLGIARAAEHGLTTARQASLYTGLMVHLGADFDRDGRCPWAPEILASPTMDGTTRLAVLYERAGSAPPSPSPAARAPAEGDRGGIRNV